MSSSLRKASCYCGNPITFHEILVKIDTYNGFVGITIMIRYYTITPVQLTQPGFSELWLHVLFRFLPHLFVRCLFSKHVHVDYVKTWPSEHIPRFSHSNNMSYYQVLRDSSICKKTGWKMLEMFSQKICPKIGFFHGRKVLQKQTSPRQTKIPESCP